MILISLKISTGNREGLTLYRNIIYKTLWNNNKHLIIYSEIIQVYWDEKLDKDLNKCETQTSVVSNLHKDSLPKIALLSTAWQQKCKKNGENSEVKDNK